jgi:AcrR family transcriptional regulator
MNVKENLANGLLELSKTKSLESIKIKDLLEYTHISKQSFYNYFLDKNDLIQYIYLSKIIPLFHDSKQEIHFYESMVEVFKNMRKYHYFMKQALLMEGQNCLKDYIYEHCQQFDLAFHQARYGKKKMSEALRFATIYHANASSSMTISWVLSDMSASEEEMAKLITDLRSVGMDKLFEDGEIKGNPYK